MGGYLYEKEDNIQPNGITGAMLNVQWNAIDFGRVSNQARQLDEKSQALIRLRRDTESMIALEVRQKWIDLHTSRERVLVAQSEKPGGREPPCCQRSLSTPGRHEYRSARRRIAPGSGLYEFVQ